MTIQPSDIQQYCEQHSQAEPAVAKAIRRYTETRPDARMLSGANEAQLLALLVKLSHAKTVVEIGSFTGYSASYLASALADDGRLFSIDHSQEHQDIARSFLKDEPYFSRINWLHNDGIAALEAFTTPIDLLFLDADKERYPAYYALAIERLAPGGLLVVDNALWSGKVLKPTEQSDQAIAKLNQLACADERVENVLLTVRDGLHIIRKKNS